VRKTGFTLAPEAGTERLRSVINKGISEADLLQAVREVFTLGWKSIKLYFMIGLPTETEEDVLEIAELAGRVKRAAKEVRKHARGGVRISVSVSSFIPKPFTPFQWEPQVAADELRRLQGILRKRLKGQSIDFKWHDPLMSRLEGLFARGDRRCAPVIMRAFQKGCRFDGWGEKFNHSLWDEALSEEGINADFYTSRKRELSETLPWDHLSTGVDKEFLYSQYERSIEAVETPDCRDSACPLCGVCDHKEVKNIIRDEPVPEPPPARVRGNLPSYKVKLAFSKQGSLRFLGHLELVKVIKRLVRRAGFPVKYSSGFHPMPKLSFSPPIPLGTESLDESMEMTLLGAPMKVEEIITRLNRESPEGLKFRAPRREPLKLGSGSDMIQKIEYLLNFEDPLCGFDIDSDRIDGCIKDFASSSTFPATIKKGEKSRSVDIKGQIADLRRLEGLSVRLVLKGEGPAIRPCDVLVHVFHIPLPEVPLIPILKTRSFR
ncbi:MAG: TIGR03936 family radical SAM-associated protein, partial [Thermodesulfobacteriota bacterium]